MPFITDQNGFTYYQDDTTGQITTPVSQPPATEQPAPPPADSGSSDKPDFTTTQTEAQREQELRDAAANAGANRDQILAEGGDTSSFDQSVKDVQTKVDLIDSYQQAGEPMPDETKALVYGPAAPFVDLSKQELDLTAAVKAGVPDEQLRKLGVSQIEIVNVRNDIKREKQGRDVNQKVADIYDADAAAAVPTDLTGKAAFDQLVTEGKIPKGSRFDHVDEQGNIVYYPPFAGLEDTKAEFDRLSKAQQQKYVEQVFRSPVLSSDQMTQQRTFAANRDYSSLSQADKERVLQTYRLDQALNQMNKDTAIGLVPIVGTIYTWQRTSTPWKAVNIATDVLTIIPLDRVIGAGAKFLKGPARDVERAIETGRSMERATLKATSTPEVVRAYDKFTKATDEFTKNQVLIRNVERDIAGAQKPLQTEMDLLRAQSAKITETINAGKLAEKELQDAKLARIKIEGRIGQLESDIGKGVGTEALTYGSDLKSAKQTLDAARKGESELAFKAKQAGDAFAKAQAEAGPKGQKLTPGKGWLKITGKAGVEDANLADFGSRTVQNVRATVDAAYTGKIGTPAQVEKQIKAVDKAMQFAQHDNDIAKVRDLVQTRLDLQSKLKIAKSGELLGLQAEYNTVGKQIVQLQKMKQTPAVAKELRELKVQKLALQKKLVESLKYNEIVWAQPFSKGGGRGRPYVPDEPWRGGGGGSRVATEPKITYAKQGAKLIYRDADGNEIWELPGVRTIPDTGKPWIKVEPQPSWLLVSPKLVGKTITREPLTFPPVAPPKTVPKREEPGRRIYPEEVPVIVPQPETEPVRRPVHPGKPKPGEITWTPSIVPSPQPEQPGTTTRTSPAPGTKTKTGTETKTGTTTETTTKTGTQDQTKQGTETKTGTQTGTQTKTGTETKTRTQTETTTQDKTRTHEETKTRIEVKAPVQVKVPVKIKVPDKFKETRIFRPHLKAGGKDWSKKDIESAAAYSAGMGVWGIRPPGGPDDWKFWMKDKAPPELKITDRNTAYDTIRLWKGTKGFTASRDMGIVDVTIAPTRQRGAPGAISFKADRSNWNRRPKPSRARLSKDIYSRRGTLSHVARRSATRMSRGGVLR